MAEILTLSDYQQQNPDALLYNGIVQIFREASTFLDVAGFMTTGRLKSENMRSGSMSQIQTVTLVKTALPSCTRSLIRWKRRYICIPTVFPFRRIGGLQGPEQSV